VPLGSVSLKTQHFSSPVSKVAFELTNALWVPPYRPGQPTPFVQPGLAVQPMADDAGDQLVAEFPFRFVPILYGSKADAHFGEARQLAVRCSES
jgi:hypothetical protein